MVTERAGEVGGWAAHARILDRHAFEVNQTLSELGGHASTQTTAAVQRRILGSDRRGDHLGCLEGAVSAGPQLLDSAGGACWQDAGQQHRAAPAG